MRKTRCGLASLHVWVLLGTGACQEAAESGNETVWEIDAIPLVDIHDEEVTGEPVVLHASGATILSSGVIAVADEYAQAIRFFDAGGKLIRSVGRQGTGPGEFRDIRWLGQCARDSLFVYEYTRAMVTVLDSGGGVVRGFRFDNRPLVLSCSRSGRMVLLGPSERYEEPAADPPQVPGPLWVIGNDGEGLERIGDVPIWQNRPVGRYTSIATADDRLYIGTAESTWVDVLRLSDRMRTSFRVADSVRVPGQHNFEASITRLTSMMPNPVVREHFRGLYRELPLPRRGPAYTGIIADALGLLWVNRSLPGDAGTELVAFDSSGRRIAAVALPESVLVWEIGEEYVLGAHYDASGLQHIVKYRLRRGGN